MNDELLMKKQVNACLNYHCEEYTIACFSSHCEEGSNLAHYAFNNILRVLRTRVLFWRKFATCTHH